MIKEINELIVKYNNDVVSYLKQVADRIVFTNANLSIDIKSIFTNLYDRVY